MPKSTMPKVNKEQVKNPLRNDAERYMKTAGMILNAMRGYPSQRDKIEYLVNDALVYNADVVDGEVIHIDHADFDSVFDRMVADEEIVKMPDGLYCRSGAVKAEPKLPGYAFPRRIFGDDQLRDELRTWLTHWFETKEYEPEPWVKGEEWQKSTDRDIRMLDMTLFALAPLCIELLAPRAGSPEHAAAILARRFSYVSDDVGGDPDAGAGMGSFVDWYRADDVNVYQSGGMEPDSGIIGHPRQGR